MERFHPSSNICRAPRSLSFCMPDSFGTHYSSGHTCQCIRSHPLWILRPSAPLSKAAPYSSFFLDSRSGLLFSCLPPFLHNHISAPHLPHLLLWTEKGLPQFLQVHRSASCSKNTSMPFSLITRRFSSGDSLCGYCAVYRFSFSITSSQG